MFSASAPVEVESCALCEGGGLCGGLPLCLSLARELLLDVDVLARDDVVEVQDARDDEADSLLGARRGRANQTGVPYAHNKPALAFTKNVSGYVPSPVDLQSFATVSVKS